MTHTGGYEVRGNVSYQRAGGTAVGPRDLTSIPLGELGEEFLRLIEEDKYPKNEGYGVYAETDDPELPMEHIADCESVPQANKLAKLLHDHWEIAQWVLDGEDCSEQDHAQPFDERECEGPNKDQHYVSIDDAFDAIHAVVEIARESYK